MLSVQCGFRRAAVLYMVSLPVPPLVLAPPSVLSTARRHTLAEAAVHMAPRRHEMREGQRELAGLGGVHACAYWDHFVPFYVQLASCELSPPALSRAPLSSLRMIAREHGRGGAGLLCVWAPPLHRRHQKEGRGAGAGRWTCR